MVTTVIESTVKKNLPNGIYSGYWSGSRVKVNHDGEEWFLKTKHTVRGINIPVQVMIAEDATSVTPLPK